LDLDNKYAIRPSYAALFVALTSFVVYLTTIAPGLDFIDAGELTTDVYTLGIAHPTGYPLFTLVGFLISHLPIASSVVLRVNIMAAFFTAIGAGAVVLLMYEIGTYWMEWQAARPSKRNVVSEKNRSSRSVTKKKTANKEVAPAEKNSQQPSHDKRYFPLIAAITAGFAAAFSATWWAQSTSIEVYPLHLALVPFVILTFLRMLRFDDPSNPRLTKHSVTFAVMLGLSFTNHMTTSFLAPATIALYFIHYGLRKTALQKIAWLAVPFVATLLLYAYLPIRSAMNPIMDWGHPTTSQLLLKHMSGGQYKIWMFSGSAAEQWKYFWARAPKEFTVIGFTLAMFGIVSIARMHGRKRVEMLTFTSLLFFGCVLFAMNYGIHDIDSYFLLAYLTIAVWIGCGVLYGLYLYRTNLRAMMIGLTAIVLIAGIEFYFNHAEADESGNHFVDDYTQNVLKNLPPNAIIYSTQWDFWVSGAYYYQLIEKLRPDVLVIDKAMLHDRPWYHHQLALRAPDVMKRAEAEEAAFMKKLVQFDAGGAFDTVGIGIAYNSMMNALVIRNLDRPTFITSEILDEREDPFMPQLKRVADGLAWRLMLSDSALDVPLPKLQWRDGHYRRRNYYTDNARWLQAVGLASTAQRLASEGKRSEALAFIDLAVRFEPDQSPTALEDLTPRDLEFAQTTDSRFAQIQQTKTLIAQSAMQKPLNIPTATRK